MLKGADERDMVATPEYQAKGGTIQGGRDEDELLWNRWRERGSGPVVDGLRWHTRD
jgi:hypothetical protein